MQSINLCTYLQEGLFFKALADTSIDAILLDTPIPPSWEPTLPVYTLTDTSRGGAGAVQALAGKHKHLLIIRDKLPAWYLLPLLHTAPKHLSITIAHLGAGVSGLLHKGMPDLSDIGHILNTSARIAEPCDVLSFFVLLKLPGLTYIRIPHKERIADMLQGNGTPTWQAGLLDATVWGYTGDEATLLCPGGLLSGLIEALHTFQSEERGMDLFVLSDYRFVWNKALIASCKKTNHLIVLLDQAPGSLYEALLTGYVAQWVGPGCTISCITPNTTPTAHLADDLRAQAGLDPLHLYTRINELLEA